MKRIIFFLLFVCSVLSASAATITVGDSSISDWGIDPQANDWVPDTGIICNNLSWRDSAGGPIFDEYQMCFYNNGDNYYFLKIVGMPPQGLLYNDP